MPCKFRIKVHCSIYLFILPVRCTSQASPGSLLPTPFPSLLSLARQPLPTPGRSRETRHSRETRRSPAPLPSQFLPPPGLSRKPALLPAPLSPLLSLARQPLPLALLPAPLLEFLPPPAHPWKRRYKFLPRTDRKEKETKRYVL
ncbi:hypothetical protein GUJ93_ZPchr0004g39977 [Zizania palustris]|uniref:Uncharacterized protein n=1 Tax=Zizania palustris TaxID=103762 RepID=A0A8J5VZB8_ZIZPA|nr:hypothetical protein GUJ93_ZPchr0004g39977 [Zizania palustris]